MTITRKDTDNSRSSSAAAANTGGAPANTHSNPTGDNDSSSAHAKGMTGNGKRNNKGNKEGKEADSAHKAAVGQVESSGGSTDLDKSKGSQKVGMDIETEIGKETSKDKDKGADIIEMEVEKEVTKDQGAPPNPRKRERDEGSDARDPSKKNKLFEIEGTDLNTNAKAEPESAIDKAENEATINQEEKEVKEVKEVKDIPNQVKERLSPASSDNKLLRDTTPREETSPARKDERTKDLQNMSKVEVVPVQEPVPATGVTASSSIPPAVHTSQTKPEMPAIAFAQDALARGFNMETAPIPAQTAASNIPSSFPVNHSPTGASETDSAMRHGTRYELKKGSPTGSQDAGPAYATRKLDRKKGASERQNSDLPPAGNSKARERIHTRNSGGNNVNDIVTQIQSSLETSTPIPGSVREYRAGCLQLEKTRHAKVFDAQRKKLLGEQRARWAFDHELRLIEEQHEAAMHMCTLAALQKVFEKQRTLEELRYGIRRIPGLPDDFDAAEARDNDRAGTGLASLIASGATTPVPGSLAGDVTPAARISTRREATAARAAASAAAARIRNSADDTTDDGNNSNTGGRASRAAAAAAAAAAASAAAAAASAGANAVRAAADRKRLPPSKPGKKVPVVERTRLRVELDVGEVMDDLQRLENGSNFAQSSSADRNTGTESVQGSRAHRVTRQRA